MMAGGLTPKQEKYVQGLFTGLSQREAYKAAYNCKNMSDNAIDVNACRDAAKPKIALRLKELQDEVKERNMVTVEKVVERWWNIATADPNEILHLRRVCCRYCYGTNHRYQWKDEDEYASAVHMAEVDAELKEKEPIIPSNEGGYGFNRIADPHPSCPMCMGEGIPDLHISDTRKLSPQAKMLFAGFKQTQAGLEVKFQDQGKALENIARHLGMFKDTLDINLRKKLEDFM